MRLRGALQTTRSAAVPALASSSNKRRQGRLRNGSEEIGGIFLSDGDVDPLTAFVRSLNEDDN